MFLYKCSQIIYFGIKYGKHFSNQTINENIFLSQGKNQMDLGLLHMLVQLVQHQNASEGQLGAELSEPTVCFSVICLDAEEHWPSRSGSETQSSSPR